MRGRPGRRVAEAPGPVTGERQEERRQAERLHGGDVEDEPGPEAGAGAEERPAKEGDRDEDDEDEVGVAVGYAERREEGDLEDRGEGEQDACLEGVEAVHGFVFFVFTCWAPGFGTRTITASSESKFTSGVTWIRLYRSTSCWPTPVTTPIGIPRGQSDWSEPVLQPAVTTLSPSSPRA